MRKWHIPYIVGMVLVMVAVWFVYILPDIKTSVEQYRYLWLNALMYFGCGSLLFIITPISATFKCRSKE